METKPNFSKVAETNFFVNSEMIKFLVAENLALKNLLHEKGIITPEEFKASKEKADNILTARVNSHISECIKSILKVGNKDENQGIDQATSGE